MASNTLFKRTSVRAVLHVYYIPEEPVMTHLTLCLSLHLIYHLKEKETRNRMKD